MAERPDEQEKQASDDGAQADLELDEETADEVTGGGGNNWSGIPTHGPQGGGNWNG